MRPGQGFAPNFPMFAKVAVNGADADPIFTLLRTACKPGYVDELGTMEATQLNVAWSPVTYTVRRRPTLAPLGGCGPTD